MKDKRYTSDILGIKNKKCSMCGHKHLPDLRGQPSVVCPTRSDIVCHWVNNVVAVVAIVSAVVLGLIVIFS